MKKLLSIVGLMALVCVPAWAQTDTTPKFKFQPFLSGYNLNLTTNGTPYTIGTTNAEYTTYLGRVVYALTNTGFVPNGQSPSNGPDAMQVVRLQGNNNGDIVANVQLMLYMNQTNWIPLTNTSGYITNWVLSSLLNNPGTQPGTANVYPAITAADTNTVTVNLLRSAWDWPGQQVEGDASGYPSLYTWDTSSALTLVFTNTGTSPQLISTNLPATWLAGARFVSMSISTTNIGNNGHMTLLNQAGLMQPSQ